jgi:hypothetical protein
MSKSSALNENQLVAVQLVASGKLSNPFKVRDIYRAGWTGLETPIKAQAAINLLLEYQHVREEIPHTGGRPTTLYHWPDIEHNPLAIDALAHAMQTRRMRECGQIPPHYTQVVHCEGCGPVWLWQGSPERIQACPWCFVRVQGITPPHATHIPSQTINIGHTVHGVIVARDADTSA